MRAVPDTPPPVLLLDAGNVLVCLDGAAVSAVLAAAGVRVDAEAIEAAEGPAKRAYETELAGNGNRSHEEAWEALLAGVLRHAGVDPERAGSLVPALRAEHERFNLWRRVPDGVRASLDGLGAAGIRLGVVSNSEGQLIRLLARLDLAGHFEHVVDSGVEGVRKPDPAIFRIALARMGVRADDAMYAGDIPRVDVDGARAAGLRAVLIDAPHLYPDYTSALRYESLAEMVAAIYGITAAT